MDKNNVDQKKPSESTRASQQPPHVFTFDEAVRWRDLHMQKAQNAPGVRMQHRKVLVTGGSSGIGLAIAKRLVSEGASCVAIVSRSSDNAHRAINTIREHTGLLDAPVWALVGDVGDHGTLLASLTHDADKNILPFNTLINCAGLSQSKHLITLKNDTITELLNVNLSSAIAMSKAFVSSWTRRIRAFQDGHPPEGPHETISNCIINVSSILANKGGAGASVYAASKAGLRAFTRALALEAGEIGKKYQTNKFHPVLRVNALVPGYIDTRMTRDLTVETKVLITRQIPLGRVGAPDEAAEAAIFLIENEYANNCNLNLDGGLSAT